MHWLHGVPPGSSEQVPASMGTPQCPLSQVRPAQHCWGVLHVEPGGRQVSVPHRPPWQTLVQQSLGTLQEKPSGMQPLSAQTSLTQLPLQHSLSSKHEPPFCEHTWAPQVD